MDTLDAIYKRRAVKHFDPDHKLTQEEETRLLEAAIQAPTSFNIQHWRFVIVRDPDLRQRIRNECGDQAQITEASLLLIVVGDIDAWKKQPERYWKDAPADISAYLVNAIGEFYKDREWLQRDEAQRSIGMALQTLMLTTKAMGYDSCPMIGFDIEKAAKLINLPADHAMGPMLAIGKATEEARPKGGQLPLSELVIENTF